MALFPLRISCSFHNGFQINYIPFDSSQNAPSPVFWVQLHPVKSWDVKSRYNDGTLESGEISFFSFQMNQRSNATSNQLELKSTNVAHSMSYRLMSNNLTFAYNLLREISFLKTNIVKLSATLANILTRVVKHE